MLIDFPLYDIPILDILNDIQDKVPFEFHLIVHIVLVFRDFS